MRRTLSLALALPATLVLLSGATTPSTAGNAAADPGVDTGATVEAVEAVAAPTGAVEPPSRTQREDLTARDPGPQPGPSPTADPEVSPPAGEAGEASDVGVPGDVIPDRGPTTPERSGEGFLVAGIPEAGAVAGSGPRWRYTVEVDPATGLDPDDVARQVRAALHDERSWARERTLEQVDDPARARIRVLVATPETVDRLCARVGLRTVGIYSCWNGRFAALNGWRWEVGAGGFDDVTTYRTYLVNHEFGHGLGYGHIGCPAAGAPAPVMMQQSKGLGGCIANGWPYP
jgi:hypothetical protein